MACRHASLTVSPTSRLGLRKYGGMASETTVRGFSRLFVRSVAVTVLLIGLLGCTRRAADGNLEPSNLPDLQAVDAPKVVSLRTIERASAANTDEAELTLPNGMTAALVPSATDVCVRFTRADTPGPGSSACTEDGTIPVTGGPIVAGATQSDFEVQDFVIVLPIGDIESGWLRVKDSVRTLPLAVMRWDGVAGVVVLGTTVRVPRAVLTTSLELETGDGRRIQIREPMDFHAPADM